jgi:hypothetical protein
MVINISSANISNDVMTIIPLRKFLVLHELKDLLVGLETILRTTLWNMYARYVRNGV